MRLYDLANRSGLLGLSGYNDLRDIENDIVNGGPVSQQALDVQQLVFAIGPADGFSDIARKSASKLISFGKMTLPHELARVVLLEQLYRAFTIIRRHPYHSGH